MNDIFHTFHCFHCGHIQEIERSWIEENHININEVDLICACCLKDMIYTGEEVE